MKLFIRMKLNSCVGILLCVCGIGLAKEADITRPLKPGYEIQISGMKRQLVVSPGELAVKNADGQRVMHPISGGDLAAQVKAARIKNAAAEEIEIVLVEATSGPKSRNQKQQIRHFVTREVVVRLKPGITGKTFAKASGLRVSREPEYAMGMLVIDAGTSEAALATMESLRKMPEVEAADVLLATQREKKWIPNDPLFPQQWHHLNTTQLGGALWMDTGITPVWDTFRGAGVTIGIIDDGVQHAHPDLQGNYNTSIDYDYNSNDQDPTPVDLAQDSHGTACAGVAAAIGGNSIGVSGAAPMAMLTGFRLIAAPSTDEDEADAFHIHNQVIHIKSNSWGPPDGTGYGGPGPLAKAALEAAVTTGRGGKGVVQVFAAGNGFSSADNSNYDGYANSPFVIAVAAINDAGFQSYYSEPGANILISAPSDSGGKNEGIRTTDLTGMSGYNPTSGVGGDYANDFGGTSSACPLVSGIIALMLEANPNLGWRDVKEILIRSARKPQRTDIDWKTNGAGLTFNHKYGAGIIDAAGAVALAQQWADLPAMTTLQSVAASLPAAMTDNDAAGVSRTVNFATANFRVEHVTVSIDATHTAIGDLEVTLTSPSGMVSKLSQAYPDGTDDLSWTYSSVFHWGESAAGNWTVKVADRLVNDTGSLTAVTVKLWGCTQPLPIVGTIAMLASETNTPLNSAADPGEIVTFQLSLKNTGSAATTALTAALLPLGGVHSPSAAQNYGAIDAGASTSRSYSFKLEGGCGMSIPLVLKLQDGSNDRGFSNLIVPLGTTATSSFIGGAITIIDNHTASPSPSELSVSGLVGRVQNLTAQVDDFSHLFVDDVGALLHGPDALKLRLFCGGPASGVSSSNLTFDDEAEIPFPAAGSLGTGSYQPSDDYGPSRDFIGDSSVEPAFSLGEYRGLSANGTWRLYVQDFATGDAGSISSWALNFTTVTCTDNVFFTTAATSGGEETHNFPVSVTRTGGREEEATVNYATSSGTATAGSDFTHTSGTLTFAPGELVKSFTIPILNDTTPEAPESFTVTLSNATGGATLGSRIIATATLLDGDSDNDTLPDDYEVSVGLNPTLNDAALDLDGDGYNNISEYIIGTLPNNGNSFFQAASSVGTANVSVAFPTLTGRLYRVERSSSLALASWSVVEENIAGTGSLTTVTDHGAAIFPKGFYRVVVTRLPN
jgi:subtilisin-like proprotein convertase family protein